MLGGFFVLYCCTLAPGFAGSGVRLRVGNCQNADLDAVFSLQCSVVRNNPSRISSKNQFFSLPDIKSVHLFSDDIKFSM